MLTDTFREFVTACYCDHWREVYCEAAFSLETDRDVLIARAVNAHHWTPGMTCRLSSKDLALSLIGEFAELKLTDMAVHVSYMNLQALPKARYQALTALHE